MSGDTVECFNCGHANPSWAQVCRSCGFQIQADAASAGTPHGIFPTDSPSLIAIGSTMGAIALAILLGLFVSGLIPEVAAEPTPSPTPTESVLPSASAAPSLQPTAVPSIGSVPPLIGTIAFGTGLDSSRHVTGATTTFHAGISFAHSIQLTQPFGVTIIQEEVVKVAADGSQTVIQKRSDMPPVIASAAIAGFRVRDAADLITGFGTGNFILRVYRGEEVIAEGQFTLQ